jgi:membrane-associated protease RseP (regulator of RpoE activity)
MLLITLTIHELGHYTFARIFKVNVKEFSIGIGPRLFSKNNKRGTRISLRLIPLMAYVMMDSVQLREVYASEKKDKNYKFMMQKKPKGTFLLEEVKT